MPPIDFLDEKEMPHIGLMTIKSPFHFSECYVLSIQQISFDDQHALVQVGKGDK